MIRLISSKNIKAKKEHRCYFCGKFIEKGEQYHKSIYGYEGVIFDITYCECCFIVSLALDMYDYLDDEELTEAVFQEFVKDYIYSHHFDDSINDIDKDWKIPFNEQVKKIYNELKTNEKYKYLWDANVANK